MLCTVNDARGGRESNAESQLSHSNSRQTRASYEFSAGGKNGRCDLPSYLEENVV
jgi:hypothetical protein